MADIDAALCVGTSSALSAICGALIIAAAIPAVAVSSGPELVIDGQDGAPDVVDGGRSTSTGTLDGTRLGHVAASNVQLSTAAVSTGTGLAPTAAFGQLSVQAAVCFGTALANSTVAMLAALATMRLPSDVIDGQDGAPDVVDGGRSTSTGALDGTRFWTQTPQASVAQSSAAALPVAAGQAYGCSVVQLSSAVVATGTGQAQASTVTQLSATTVSTGAGQSHPCTVTQLSDAAVLTGTGQSHPVTLTIIVLASLPATADGFAPDPLMLILVDTETAVGSCRAYGAAAAMLLPVRTVITADGIAQKRVAHIGETVRLSAVIHALDDDVTPILADFDLVYSIDDGVSPEPSTIIGLPSSNNARTIIGELQPDGTYRADWTVTAGRGPIYIHATSGVAGYETTECVQIRRRA